MNEETDSSKQAEENMPVSPLWLKVFLAINISVMVLFFVYTIAYAPETSEEERLKTIEFHDELISEALSKNPQPMDLTGALSDEVTYIVDATKLGRWAHFSFSKLTVHYSDKIEKDSLDWDIAFLRAKIVTNGGKTGKGKAAVSTVEDAAFETVETAEGVGAFLADDKENITETKNPALDHWYIYDFWTHQLKPTPVVYLLRTADSHYAKFQITGYYCGNVPACYKLRYVYQGGDSKSFVN